MRPEGHDGPHMIQRLDGRYVVWGEDLCPEGECAYCDSEDPTDHCLWYDYAEPDDAIRYRDEVDFAG